ncbi:MAG: bifunctional phosphopantothenoylcysteine decarboxylase/phosphopantothenate--cysteine ligase CoaBC [Ignavibacteriales bacterium]|nr:bifunctional phosphopantothenoylcysteine decarboxylase/phosphopantothenate--cysteine ligase CoaBC [Ignavibacteriales bacterium]
MLRGKHILVGVTGGIAAYKICYLVRDLRKAGADVQVVMTEAAAKFVTPLTFSALSGHDVVSDLWTHHQSTGSDIGTQHIALANWADAFVIAPASANTIAKLTYGLSDNLLTIVALASRCPIVLAPTMDADMYLNPVTQQNVSKLQERGYIVVPPDEGELASGLKGPGRLPEIQIIIETIERMVGSSTQDLKGKNILVTAGPTYEAIDPVRFIGNRSSGKMGFALANAAAMRGAHVTLVSGPVKLETPRNVTRVDVESAAQMHEAVTTHAQDVDAVIMAAAVADFTPQAASKNKIKKGAAKKEFSMDLTGTPDILLSLGQKKKKGTLLVGFALETQDELRNAQEKLRRKNLDFIVLNSLKDKGAGFSGDTNVVTIVDRKGRVEKLPLMSKFDVANQILNRVRTLL